ncbi:tyrosine-protein phosphatase non-receptor type 5 isoform X1 [Phyllopteryx taeniolatus]|uniref:tyrosine-protein phosphatase non-receptor type 5 isoform X1 n=1 Tax=Phyllopteryx taeniolatus TaxID=161469 RepID=UPI002AD2F91A|nr:tyrosine-protein phosphatase non-receptor type 5 isoform X1 [Phyllopteryx taeniolatus]XP_061617722.1 tyrosine-protein phosphatase non-receptor type 5 isoform X1 [Phyllopteryx taeniolatus]
MKMRSTGGCLLLALMLLCWLTCAESSSGEHELRNADSSDLNPHPDGSVPPRRHRWHHRHHLHHHRSGGEVHVEHATVAARHLVTMFLALDVRSLNTALLRWFRGGVAAALGVPVGLVHINAVDEEKNGVEFFVSSERPDDSEPRPARDVVRSLDVRVLHRHLAHFGITEVSTEKKVLQGAPREHARRQECFYILFFTIFIMALVCSTLFYRLKKTWEPQPKAAPPHFTAKAAAHAPRRRRPIAAARPLPAPALPPPPSPAPSSEVDRAPLASVAPVTNELDPCSSPFRMKLPSRLQERRGSNVALVLDMSVPVGIAVVTPPREEAAREYLMAAGHALTPQRLRDLVKDAHTLHAEFSEIPMNFTDSKQVDVPNHGSKNRYKTILPSESWLLDPHSRVVLQSPLSTYINANYIRGYRGDEKAFIATQGPMVNTVDDFWLMAWQEAAPAIVMITKLKEKNEKCVLYWPERRGMYRNVEVEVNGVRERQHYTARHITLKAPRRMPTHTDFGPRTHTLLHYWFTSWPDHKTPDATLPLLQLMDDVEAARRAAASGPVIVHCSAGIGRTGCFIAASVGARQLAAEGAVDVLAITCQLRLDRGGMIQTAEQYQFVHHALSLYESRQRRRGNQDV